MSISADNISCFFKGTSRNAQGMLPELIRRLIFAQNMGEIISSRFPTGDEVRQKGFDGYVVWNGSSPWIPFGKSVWEVGCNANPVKKANEDWIAADSRKWPKKVQRKQEYTWVFVTPHTWTTQDRNIWREEKKKESKWKDITIIDSTDLESWIASCPVVCRWLGKIMGMQIKGIYTLEEQLSYFLAKYDNIEEKAKLIVGGRTENVDTFEKWVTSSNTIIDIYGESRQDTIWFIAAAALSLSPSTRNSLMSRLIYVDSSDAVDAISYTDNEVIIVPLTEETESKALPLINCGCRIICPRVKKKISLIPPKNSIMELNKVRAGAIQSALQNLGISERNSGIIARESKGSIHAVIWALDESVVNSIDSNNIIIYASLWLAGQWDEVNNNDKALIETIAEKSWADIEPIIASELIPCKQFEKFGRLVDWKAWPTHMESIRNAFSASLLDRYKSAILKVFSQIDPKVKMSGNDRLFANINNIEHPYSIGIRMGLLSSLAMMGVYIPEQRSFVNQIVDELLSGNGESLGTKWATMASALGDLAEAAPERFIKACSVLVTDSDACKCIFINDDDILSARSFHCNLLWALERLAWSPEYFGEVVDILACFDELELKTKMSNSPINSLVELFLPWHVSTLADYSLRQSTFLTVAIKHPDVGWELACKLMPSARSIASGTQKPKWHNWLESGIPSRTKREYWDFSAFIIDWMIDAAPKDHQCWSKIIDRFPKWSNCCSIETKQKFFDSLNMVDVATLKMEVRKKIYETLLTLISNNVEYPDAKWAMDDEQLSLFRDLLNKFAFQDVLMRNLCLFDPWPKNIKRKMSYGEREKYLKEERINAIKTIYQSSGIDSILHILDSELHKAWTLGYSLSQIDISEVDENKIISDGLKVPIDPICQEQGIYNFIRGYFTGKIYPITPENTWVNRILQHPLNWDVTMYANLSLLLPPMQASWDWIEGKGQDVKRVYWQNVNYNVLAYPDTDLEKSVSELLSASRPCMAIDTIAMALHGNSKRLNLSADLIETAVINAAHEGTDLAKVNAQMLPYNIDQILQYLESIGKTDKELIHLEFLWMDALDQSERGIKSLQKCLSTEPNLFNDILVTVFKSEKEEKRELSENEQQRARMCYSLLDNWTNCPATEYADGIKNINRDNEDNADKIPFRLGTIDETKLNHYFNEARNLAKNTDRLEICDSQLGETLAYSPLGTDDIWPANEVCRLIESISSDSLDNGIAIGVNNKRGLHSGASGGHGELAIVVQFKKYLDARNQYPRTRRILNNIIKNFESEAKFHQEREHFEEFGNN